MFANVSQRRIAWAALVIFTSSVAAQAATLAPDINFGGGDSWRAPFEVLAGDSGGSDSISPGLYNFLGNALTNTSVNVGNLERGLAYNPTTGNLIMVSRNDVGGPAIRILSSATGADIGALQLGTDVITGGLFVKNMIGVGSDGAIYVTNLTTDATASPFKIYRWASEAATTPTLAYSGTPLAAARTGDSFDVIGAGADTRLVAGLGNGNFAVFDTDDGLTFTANAVTLSATPPATVPAAGEFRLGLTFQDADTVLGKANANPVNVVDLTGATTGNVTAQFSTAGISLRPMDFAVIAGRPILTMIEATNDTTTARSRVYAYDMSDLSLPLAQRQIAVATALPATTPPDPSQFANANGTGSIKFGAINGNVAEIFAMSTNNGIQKFILTVDSANFNDDSVVDGADFDIWASAFGQPGNASGDANGDGRSDGADFLIWQAQFGTTGLATAAATGVPEPAGALMALSALVALAASRRKN